MWLCHMIVTRRVQFHRQVCCHRTATATFILNTGPSDLMISVVHDFPTFERWCFARLTFRSPMPFQVLVAIYKNQFGLAIVEMRLLVGFRMIHRLLETTALGWSWGMWVLYISGRWIWARHVDGYGSYRFTPSKTPVKMNRWSRVLEFISNPWKGSPVCCGGHIRLLRFVRRTFPSCDDGYRGCCLEMKNIHVNCCM